MDYQENQSTNTPSFTEMNERFDVFSPPPIKRVVRWHQVFSPCVGSVGSFDLKDLPPVSQSSQLNDNLGIRQQEHPPSTKFPRPVTSFTHNAHPAAFASLKTTNQSQSIPATSSEHLRQCQGKNQEQNGIFHTDYYSMDGHSFELHNEETDPVTTAMNKPPMTLPLVCIAIGLLFMGVFVVHQTYSSNNEV